MVHCHVTYARHRLSGSGTGGVCAEQAGADACLRSVPTAHASRCARCRRGIRVWNHGDGGDRRDAGDRRRNGPHFCCLVPEKRRGEVTTEGGTDGRPDGAIKCVMPVRARRRRKNTVSLFIVPMKRKINAAAEVGARVSKSIPAATPTRNRCGTRRELARIASAATRRPSGAKVNAGHGLTTTMASNCTPNARGSISIKLPLQLVGR
ncbi:pyridoxine 5'-phosphate synthase [Salmonella enterica subsp. enterica]|nr:pyridoxine 5'-phosphate synthase [Salmonella enterica subsp. enterica]